MTGWGIGFMLAGAAALAAPERGIPRGEEHPQVVEKVFDSPVGELQFTVTAGRAYSAYLRNAKGNLMAFTELKGPRVCGEWFLSSKFVPPPSGCEFSFYDQISGRSLSVRSEELEEAGLFESARGALRGRRADVAF